MNIERLITPSADPASHDPSEARPENAALHDAAQAPDPTERYMGLLDRLVDIGMEQIELRAADAREEFAARSTIRAARVAAAVAAAEAAETGAPVESDPTQEQLPALEPSDLAIQRLSRSVRLCMALALRFQADQLDREQGRDRTAPKQQRKPSPKERLERQVKDKIEREAEPAEQEILLSELRERLEEDDIERGLEQYAPEEMVVQICRDLGAGPDGDFGGMGTLIIERVIVDPPPHPDEPFREQLPPETIRTAEVPQPLHVIRAMNRRKRPSG